MTHNYSGQRSKPTDMTACSRRRLIEMIRSGMTSDEILATPLRRNNGEEIPISPRHLVSVRADLRRTSRMDEHQFDAMMLGVAP